MALKAGLRKALPGNDIAAELAWRCIGSLSDDAATRYDPSLLLNRAHPLSAFVSPPDPLPKPLSHTPIRATPSTTPSCPPLAPCSVSSTSFPSPVNSMHSSRPRQVNPSSVQATMHFGRRRRMPGKDGR